jgi:PAS domain S-box-containing protein
VTMVEALRARSRSFGVCGIGAAVLLGWWLGTLALRAGSPEFASTTRLMLPFLPAGIAIALLGDERPSLGRRVTVRVLAAIVLALGTATMVGPSVDAALGHAPTDETAIRGLSGMSFALIAGALVAHDLDPGQFPARARESLVLLPGFAALLLVVAQLYDVPRVSQASPALVDTSVGLFVACLAILAARPSRGIARLVTSRSAAGRFLRRSLPAAILLPVAFGAVRVAAERTGRFDPGTGQALQSVLEALGLSAVVAWNARTLFRTSEARRSTLERLRESEEDLRIMLDSVGDGVIATDAAGRIARMTRAAERSTGYRLSDAFGKRFDMLFHAVDRETGLPVESPFDHVTREGNAHAIADRTLLLGPDGTERGIVRSGAPVLSKLGILRGVVLVLSHAGGLTRRSGR